MRLARHDELVERVARATHYAEYDADAYPFELELEDVQALLRKQATAALDALLTAVIELETTKQGVLLGTEKQWVACTLTEENRLGAQDVLIPQLEEKQP